MQVANDETSAVLGTLLWESVRGRNSETCAHRDAQVRRCTVLLAKFKNGGVKVFSKVDDSVLKEAIAARRLTFTSRTMLFSLLSVANSSVAHILSATLFTDLEVCIAVEFRQIGCRDAALPVKTIHILTHNKFQVVLLCELDQGHMSFGRVCLLDRSPDGL